MRNEQLEHVILANLRRVDCGLKAKTLQCAVEVEMDRPDLTTAEFEDCLKALEDKALINQYQNLMGNVIWGITETGRAALKGI